MLMEHETLGADHMCYVCFGDDEVPRSPCACKDRFVHVACQLRLVERSGAARCDVCLAPFPNVHVDVTYRSRVSMVAIPFVMIHIVSTFPIYYWISWFVRMSWPASTLADMAIFCVLALLSCVALAGYAIMWRNYARGEWRFLAFEKSCRVRLVDPQLSV